MKFSILYKNHFLYLALYLFILNANTTLGFYKIFKNTEEFIISQIPYGWRTRIDFTDEGNENRNLSPVVTKQIWEGDTRNPGNFCLIWCAFPEMPSSMKNILIALGATERAVK